MDAKTATIPRARSLGHRVKLQATVFMFGALWALTPWASPPAALACGMVLAIVVGNPFVRQAQRASSKLLRASVVLLGFGMNLVDVLVAGFRGLLFAIATIAGALGLGALLGRWLKIPAKTATLISAGTAICGGSAIAAVGSVLDAGEAEMSVAIGTVFLLNAIALFLFPVLGHRLGLSQEQFGTWAGVAIHDISSVVGAAKVYGSRALSVATAVKLSRSLWIVPVALLARWFYLRNKTQDPQTAKPLRKPWFILYFLLASVARTWIPAVAQAAPLLGMLASRGLTLTLYLIGSGLSLAALKRVGWRPLAQGTILWAMLGGLSLLAIRGIH
ncbi:MAG: putative sulfate exporter family transporter [Cyanobacteria bacterium REEB65]|nr:putative sulfate exporter family transporter [Cyanobacteria bacterium REEB65]